MLAFGAEDISTYNLNDDLEPCITDHPLLPSNLCSLGNCLSQERNQGGSASTLQSPIFTVQGTITPDVRIHCGRPLSFLSRWLNDILGYDCDMLLPPSLQDFHALIVCLNDFSIFTLLDVFPKRR